MPRRVHVVETKSGIRLVEHHEPRKRPDPRWGSAAMAAVAGLAFLAGSASGVALSPDIEPAAGLSAPTPSPSCDPATLQGCGDLVIIIEKLIDQQLLRHLEIDHYPEVTPSPSPTASPSTGATATPSSRPRPTTSSASSRPTPRPTPRSTPRPTARPTARPTTPAPTATPCFRPGKPNGPVDPCKWPPDDH